MSDSQDPRSKVQGPGGQAAAADAKAMAAKDDLAQLTAKPVPEERLADVVEEIEEKNWDPQAMYNAGGHFKEQLEAIARSGRVEERESVSKEKEVEEIVEIPVEPEVGKEVEGYIEKVEKAAELKQPVVDDYTQQILIGSANPQQPQVILPLTDDQIQQGLHHKVWEGIRWLAEWCVRQMKKLRRV